MREQEGHKTGKHEGTERGTSQGNKGKHAGHKTGRSTRGKREGPKTGTRDKPEGNKRKRMRCHQDMSLLSDSRIDDEDVVLAPSHQRLVLNSSSVILETQASNASDSTDDNED